MKKHFSIALLASAAWILLSGCGDSSPKTEEPAPATSQAQDPPPQPPALPPLPAVESSADPVAQAKEAAAELQNQAATTAATVQKQAAAAYQTLSSQLVASVQSNPDPVVKDITSDLGDRVAKLGAALQGTESAKTQLTSALRSLLAKEDLQAVNSLSALTEAKLTPEQASLAKDVYNAAAALVTQRNFSGLEGMNSEVASVAQAVWKGNYTEALPPLQRIWTEGKLTDQQKNLLGATFDKVAPGWRDGAAKIQQGLDAIKGFNK